MRKYTSFIIALILFSSNFANAYDDKISHRDITEKSVLSAGEEYKLESYLVHNLGLKDGFNTKLGIMGEGKSITEWIKQGSINEDTPLCRASNHFHNPRLDWDKSKMSDHPAYIGAYCAVMWGPWYSNVTWATGFKSRNGDKVTFDDIRLYLNGGYHGWDTARDYFYKALTETEEIERNLNYIYTFKDLGHVVHLLQDTSVPSHVRNDFMSHWKWYDSFTLNFSWHYQPYERYVKNKPVIITNADPVFPTFDSSTMLLTDFWDTDIYNGSNPSTSTSVGLSEYANANFFSESTIPNNNPDDMHKFDNPKINRAEYEICDDDWTSPSGSEQKRFYIKRTDSHGCQPIAAFRILYPITEKLEKYPEETVADYLFDNLDKFALTVEDEKVLDTYANELIPRTIGYSAGLLEYFFRGQIDGVGQELVNDSSGNITGITMKIKNSTLDEAIKKPQTGVQGKFVVSYQYTDANDNLKYGVSGEVALKESIPSGGTSASEYTFSFGDNPVPSDAGNMKFWLVFRGKLGAEDDAVAAKVLDTTAPSLVLVPYTYSDGFLEPEVYKLSEGSLSQTEGVLEKWDTSNLYYRMVSPVVELKAVATHGKILYSHPADIFDLYSAWDMYRRDVLDWTGLYIDAPAGYESNWDYYGAGHRSAVWDAYSGLGGVSALHLIFPEGAELRTKDTCGNPDTYSFLSQRESDWSESFYVMNPSDKDKWGRSGYKKRDWTYENTGASGTIDDNNGTYMLHWCSPSGVGPKGARYYNTYSRRYWYRMPKRLYEDYSYSSLNNYTAEDYIKYLNPATLEWEDTGNIFNEDLAFQKSYTRNTSTSEFDLYYTNCPSASTVLPTMDSTITRYTDDDKRLLGMLKDTPLYIDAHTTYSVSATYNYNIDSKDFEWTEYITEDIYDSDGNVIGTKETPVTKHRNELWLMSYSDTDSEIDSGTAVLKLGEDTLESYSFSETAPSGTRTCILKDGADPEDQLAYECTYSGSDDLITSATIPSIVYHNSFDTDKGELQLVVTFRKSFKRDAANETYTLSDPKLYIRGYANGTVDIENSVKAVYGYSYSEHASFSSGASISYFTASVDKSGKFLLIGYTVFDSSGSSWGLPTNNHPGNASFTRKHYIIDLDTMARTEVLTDAQGYDATYIGFVRETAGGACQ